MEKDIQNHNNDEIEIDLVELFGELKKNWKLIAGTTVAFAAAAAIYSFCIAKPVYQYNAMIRIPANIVNHSFAINTCTELLKTDGVASVTNPRNTSLLKLSFSANSPQDAKKAADAYIPKAEKKVNEIIKEADAGSLEKAISIVAKKDNAVVIKESKAKIILQDKGLDVPVSPNKKKVIAVATLLGLFVSCVYTIGKFLWKK